MPVLQRLAKERREWTDEHREVLARGTTYFKELAPGFFQPRGELDMVAVEAGWVALWEELLPKYILDHPGRRPWGWWIFDAPEPTRQLLGGFDAFKDGPVPLLVDEILKYGCGWYISVGEAELRDPPVIETQAGFLERHGLLLDVERVALGDGFAREAPMCCKEL